MTLPLVFLPIFNLKSLSAFKEWLCQQLSTALQDQVNMWIRAGFHLSLLLLNSYIDIYNCLHSSLVLLELALKETKDPNSFILSALCLQKVDLRLKLHKTCNCNTSFNSSWCKQFASVCIRMQLSSHVTNSAGAKVIKEIKQNVSSQRPPGLEEIKALKRQHQTAWGEIYI